MIVLIRKWIAWLLVLLIILGASAYRLADDFWARKENESVQVMSYRENAEESGTEKVFTEPANGTKSEENAIASANADSDLPAEEPVQAAETQTEEENSWKEQANELKWQRNNELGAEYDELKSMAAAAEDAEVRAQAERRMLEIKNAQKIVEQTESMLKLKGYEAAVFVEGEQISALIDKNLPTEEGIVIAEIVERTSGFAKENVLVIPR